MPRALIAFDKFKHSIDALMACEIAAQVLNANRADWDVDLCPLTDGGEGFARILTLASQGHWVPQEVTGPRGNPVPAGLGWVEWKNIPETAQKRLGISVAPNARIALVEMALSSGIESLVESERDPWLTHTTGTGELIALASQQGAAMILLGIGGSATNDLGLGALAALGVNAINAHAQPIRPPCPQHWSEVLQFQGNPLPGLPPLRIACDVENPLLGPYGCTAVYGPQKGLRPEDFSKLEALATAISALLCGHFHQPTSLRDEPGTGAAGGIGFGLRCALPDTTFVPGASLVSDWLRLEERIAAADWVLTGEGRFDRSSLSGKGPGSLIRAAETLGKPSLVLCGSLEAGLPLPTGTIARSITPAGVPLTEALAHGAKFLEHCLHEVLSDRRD